VTRFQYALDLSQLHASGHVKAHPTADVVILKLASMMAAPAGTPPGLSLITALPGVQLQIQQQPPPNVGTVGMPTSNFRRYADALVSNEVFVFGYPVSVGQADQIDHSRPLLRKGIIAGKNDAKSTIILDCPMYQGNSGGLVVEIDSGNLFNRQIYGLGVVSQFVPFVEKFQSLSFPDLINTTLENSGYSIVTPMDRVLELL